MIYDYERPERLGPHDPIDEHHIVRMNHDRLRVECTIFPPGAPEGYVLVGDAGTVLKFDVDVEA